MRLLVGAFACFALLGVFAERGVEAQPTNPVQQIQRESVGGTSTTTPVVDWFSVYKPKAIEVTATPSPGTLDPPKEGPVLLPLPPEGWACVLLLASIAGFRGLKRARII